MEKNKELNKIIQFLFALYGAASLGYKVGHWLGEIILS